MKAAVRDRYGPPEVVRVEEIPTPQPTGDEILVRTHAASVNRADLDGLGPRWQFLRPFLGLRRPRNRQLGLDFAGAVEAVGPNVTRFRPGHRVYGDLSAFSDGSFAEYVRTPERACRLIPSFLSFEEAACLPHAAVLALQGLRLRNGRTIKAGDRVLVDGACGNVGPFAIQIAKAMGAEVTAVDAGDKLDLARSLGADHVIDYRAVDYTRAGERYDWIVAVDAHHGYVGIRRALRPDGVYTCMGGSGWWLLRSLVVPRFLSLGSRRWMGLMWWWKPFNPDDIATIEGLIADGKLSPVIDRRYTLDKIVEALRHVDDAQARGKVIITVAESA